MSSILLLSSLLKVRLAPRGARLASNAGESPHSSAISIVQEPLPSTWKEGRRNGDEMRILHASISASSPREKKTEDFSEGRFFPPRPRPFGRGPVKRKATYSTQEKTKSKPLGKKMRKARAAGVSSRQTRPARFGGRRMPDCSFSSFFSRSCFPSLLLSFSTFIVPFVPSPNFSRCEAPSAPSKDSRFSAPPVWRSRSAWALPLERMSPDKLRPILVRRRRKTAPKPRKVGWTLKIQAKR